jgi:GntR family transcriptional repressor for pyruvate dehydrogenase complex
MSKSEPIDDRLQRAGKDLTGSLLELFKRLIADGAVTPGDKLPAERELAEMLGVSRSSLRQALKVLESMGVISQRVGSGTRLNPGAASILAEPLQFLILLDGITFAELIDARLIVEPKLAALAAERAQPADLNALRQAIVRMEEGASNMAEYAASDLEFHQAVYAAAGNRVCAMLFTVVHQSLEQMIQFTAVLSDPQRTIRSHRRILSAIKRGDQEDAYRRMLDHLDDVRGLLKRAVDSQARTSLKNGLDRIGTLK